MRKVLFFEHFLALVKSCLQAGVPVHTNNLHTSGCRQICSHGSRCLLKSLQIISHRCLLLRAGTDHMICLNTLPAIGHPLRQLLANLLPKPRNLRAQFHKRVLHANSTVSIRTNSEAGLRLGQSSEETMPKPCGASAVHLAAQAKSSQHKSLPPRAHLQNHC